MHDVPLIDVNELLKKRIDGDGNDEFTEGYNFAVHENHAPTEEWSTRASDWILCSEKMPETNRRVLVLFKDNLHDKTFCGVAFWGCSMKRKGQFTWMFPVFPMQYDVWLIPEWAQCEVTHWMPLPDPPKSQ